METNQSYNPETVRADFPILDQQVNGNPLVYLDNAATTQKPTIVIDAIDDYYRRYNSNVHRGAHELGVQATRKFEQSRETLSQFINSPDPEQVIWVRGTTEAINLVAATWGRDNVSSGDKIIVSHLEHHSNIVPWQLLAAERNAELKVIPVSDKGELDLEEFQKLLVGDVKLVALNHASNALGTLNPVEQIVEMAHSVGARVLIDGAQAIGHWPVDVQELGCDFYAFSGHKMFGPTGIGVLWGKKELLESMPPYQSGGEMIERVSFEGTSFNMLPYKFEAGTPNIVGAIGIAAAVKYLNSINRLEASEHENRLLHYLLEQVPSIPEIRRIGCPKRSASLFSFVLEGAHPEDVGTLLDQQGVAVRTGHHCAQPVMERFGIPGTIRASFSIYNTFEDVDRLLVALLKARNLLLQEKLYASRVI